MARQGQHVSYLYRIYPAGQFLYPGARRVLPFGKKRLTKIVAGLVLTLASGTQSLQADSFNASVRVQNAFALSAVQQLTFGTIRAAASVYDEALYTVFSDGSPARVVQGAQNGSQIDIISAGSPAKFVVAGAAPYTNLTISVPREEVTMTAIGAPPLSAGFVIQPNFGQQGWNAQITSGSNTGLAYLAETPNLLTDKTGSVSFALGGTLRTENASEDGKYVDQEYVGIYSVNVNY